MQRWFGPERILWIILMIVVLTVSIAPLVFAVDASFYEETNRRVQACRSQTVGIDRQAQKPARDAKRCPAAVTLV
ncbi:hypothetical protein DPM13_15400 [Paracoccus mutanolyticus]|uniref:Secreted protein n=2 Tax=Paracoccus mutanolyticus TaxID=1499308 RepID=A0ABN5M7H2_9RHOB|nr:hypothetical protein DPM13_15400 [Paracoccus mutanolyticus]